MTGDGPPDPPPPGPPPPPDSAPAPFIEGANQWAELFYKIGLAGAGAFALYQFVDFKTERRIERTTEYIREFERGEIADARSEINSELRPYTMQFIELDRNGGVSPEDKTALVAALIEESGEGVAQSFDRVVDFYEGLELCVAERLCEAKTAKGYFSEGRAQEFWENYAPYIALRRENNPQFAAALEWFAGGMKAR